MLSLLVSILMVASATLVQLPHRFTPRDTRSRFCGRWIAAASGRAWSGTGGPARICGALQWAIKASSQRKGGYYYYFPTAALGRKILWEGKTNDGFQFIDYFPPGSIARKNDTEMLIQTTWGSHFRIVAPITWTWWGPTR